MAAGQLQTFVLAFFVLIVAISSDVTKRKVVITPWPQCESSACCNRSKESGKNVVYAKASANVNNDNLYYAFSTINLPTIVFARAIKDDADMKFDWEKLGCENGSIYDAITLQNSNGKDPVTPEYMYGLTFTKLIEYDDVHDTASLEEWEKKRTKDSKYMIREFHNFTWMSVPDQLGKIDYNFVFNTTTDMLPKSNNGSSLSFSFLVQGKSGRASDLPSLKYGANETMFDFVMANYTPSFEHSRFALEAVVVSLSGKDTKMSLEKSDSIDDEYSPGVFEITNWLSDPKKQHIRGFFQWKPVAYLSKDKGRKTATKVKYYELEDLGQRPDEAEWVNRSIIAAMFGKDLWDDTKVIIRTTNISFGLPKDGFYLENNYTTWSAAVGYGSPPEDEISTTVIIIISAGLGLPVVIIIFGGIYSIIRKIRNRSSQYEVISGGSVSRHQPQVN